MGREPLVPEDAPDDRAQPVLKSEKGKTSEHQERWLGLLRACPGIEVFLWRPSDLERVAEVLR
jgi:hypothetical protein